MIEIIIVRHGQTKWNVGEVFRGRIDVELDETGLQQAELLAEYLGSRKIEAVYSSPLKRAYRTAGTIAGYHNLEVQVTPGLIDFNYGEWQGLSHQEVKEKYRELYREWTENPQRVITPGGESLDDVRGRVTGVVNEITAKNESTVVLVAHRVVNKVLICALLGLDNSHFWEIRQDTCAMTTFSYEKGRFVLSEHNNTSYLESMKQEPLSDF